jgi:hypothetical protein
LIVLALTVFTACAIAAEARDSAKPFTVNMICTKSSQQSSGLSKVCYYNCGETEGAMRVQIYDVCPLRGRLNRTGSFGPSGVARQTRPASRHPFSGSHDGHTPMQDRDCSRRH